MFLSNSQPTTWTLSKNIRPCRPISFAYGWDSGDVASSAFGKCRSPFWSNYGPAPPWGNALWKYFCTEIIKHHTAIRRNKHSTFGGPSSCFMSSLCFLGDVCCGRPVPKACAANAGGLLWNRFPPVDGLQLCCLRILKNTTAMFVTRVPDTL